MKGVYRGGKYLRSVCFWLVEFVRVGRVGGFRTSPILYAVWIHNIDFYH